MRPVLFARLRYLRYLVRNRSYVGHLLSLTLLRKENIINA